MIFKDAVHTHFVGIAKVHPTVVVTYRYNPRAHYLTYTVSVPCGISSTLGQSHVYGHDEAISHMLLVQKGLTEAGFLQVVLSHPVSVPVARTTQAVHRG